MNRRTGRRDNKMSTAKDCLADGKIYRDTMYLAVAECGGMMSLNESNWGITVEEEIV
ncbi:MAG TPA: hypothetical protein VKD70_16745 [Candidatus Acidoferrum sp.]|nr:hypothetical protein [Candidatus Acidoferrum sp.]